MQVDSSNPALRTAENLTKARTVRTLISLLDEARRERDEARTQLFQVMGAQR